MSVLKNLLIVKLVKTYISDTIAQFQSKDVGSKLSKKFGVNKYKY